MIRISITPNKSNFNVSLNFPDDYLNEEVKIIAFKKLEGLEEKDTHIKTASFTFLSVNTGDFEFTRNEANER